MLKTNVKFKSRDGHILAGVLHRPLSGQVRAYALFAHCFTCTKNINAATNIAGELAKAGIATLRFDFTGLGASKGDFADTSFTGNVNDLVDAASFLEREYEAPQVLVGHSLGGIAVLYAAKQLESVLAVACIAAPSTPSHVLHLLELKLDELKENGKAEVVLAGRPFVFKQCFVDDVMKHDLDFSTLRKSVLIMHSPTDGTVGIDEAHKIYHGLKHPKSFVTLDKADHLLSKQSDSEYAARVLSCWADKYIPAMDTPAQEAGGVIVTAEKSAGFLTSIAAGAHHIIADEPSSLGGTDKGATPYDLLSAALGACTTMTLNMYARRKKLDVDNVTVRVEHNKIYAEDCADCENKKQKIDEFTRHISIEGNLTEAELSRMIEIADLCPVHKTLESQAHIITEKA